MGRPFKVGRLQSISLKEGDISQGKKPSLKKNAMIIKKHRKSIRFRGSVRLNSLVQLSCFMLL